jgi:hypothetical protein
VVFPGVRSPRLNRREFPSFGYHSELRPVAWREIDLDSPTGRPTAEARGRAFRRLFADSRNGLSLEFGFSVDMPAVWRTAARDQPAKRLCSRMLSESYKFTNEEIECRASRKC